jgi:hypothetical protein
MARRVATVCGAAAVAVVAYSYVHALTLPGTESLRVKSVEWVRTHGGASLVREAENLWYSHHQPPRRGRADLALVRHPATHFSPAALDQVRHLRPPSALAPILEPGLPGEGRWTPVGRLVRGVPALYATYLRPDPLHPSVVTGVAWMDTDLLTARLFSGIQIPGVGGFHDMAPLTPAEDAKLVAEFNSGFLMQDAYGGYYSEGRLVYTMRPGAASLVIYRNGKATVAKWGRDASMSAEVASVRQNLDLLVDRGELVSGLRSDASRKWGATLGNREYVWRSGLGVTRSGALVYAGGPDLSVYTLARVLLRAGAIRAMELDINTDWVDFFYFDPRPGRPAAPSNGVKLVANMADGTDRYFAPSTRDFVAMFARG